MLSDDPVAVALPASDIARSRKFYEETLGLKPEPSGSMNEATYRVPTKQRSSCIRPPIRAPTG